MIDIDMTTLRAIATLLTAVAFVLVCLWVFRPGSKKHYDEAAKLPFEHADTHSGKPTDTASSQSSKESTT